MDHEMMRQASLDAVNTESGDVLCPGKHTIPHQFRQCLHCWQKIFLKGSSFSVKVFCGRVIAFVVRDQMSLTSSKPFTE
jgi:hypothetical protein